MMTQPPPVCSMPSATEVRVPTDVGAFEVDQRLIVLPAAFDCPPAVLGCRFPRIVHATGQDTGSPMVETHLDSCLIDVLSAANLDGSATVYYYHVGMKVFVTLDSATVVAALAPTQWDNCPGGALIIVSGSKYT